MSEEPPNPLVTVVIPMYNERESIEATLTSLVDQTYDQIEFVVVDDGSEDGSARFAEELLEGTHREYRVLQNTTNLGQSFARNRGAMHAEGDYIVFHDADDLSTPERIEKQVAFMESNPAVGVVGGAYYYLNPNRGQAELKSRPTDDASIRSGMGRECMVNLGTAMFRREALFGTDLFESQNVEGYELMVNIAVEWELANLADPVYTYIINEGSRSQRNQVWKKTIIAYRSYQAITKLGLPYYYLPLQLGWFVYMNAPPALKRVIRRVFSPTEIRDITDEERQMIEQLRKDSE
jgi:glycosyltransferase involved in cell wall biosynthesis